MIRILKLSAITLLLTGCAASGLVFQPVEVNPSDKAVVYVYRPGRLYNAAGYPKIFVNGKEQFELRNKGYGVLQLEPGEHEILAEGSFFTGWAPGKASIKISVKAGEEHFIRVTPQVEGITFAGAIFSTSTMVVSGSAQVIEVKKEFALTEIRETKKAE